MVYFVVETIAPEGYKKSNKTYSFSITENGARVFVDDIKNPPIKGNVSVLKIDSLTKEQLKGAEFIVYNDVDKDGLITDGIDTVYGVMLHDEGYRYYLNDLPYGEYVLKETKAPDGFELDENAYPFEIVENGDVRNIETLAGVGFINDAQKGDLVITKRSSDKKLEGFSFRITGKAVTGQEYDQTFKTDEQGKIEITGLRIGTYTVSEIAD